MRRRPRHEFFEELMRFIEEAMMHASNQTGRRYIPSHALGEQAHEPFVDLIDSDKEYILTAELPGVRKEDIRINATEEEIELSIEESKGKRTDREEVKASSRYSGFSETYSLSDEIKPEEINAKYRNGVLEIHAPKKSSRKGEKINIE